MGISMDISMDIPMDINEKIRGYGCGYEWEISYLRQAWTKHVDGYTAVLSGRETITLCTGKGIGNFD